MSDFHGLNGSAKRRILVVEDETLLSIMLEEMLEEIGHAVAGQAARVEEAVQLAQSGGFDAAILDVHLNGKEVYPVADVLTARGIPFVFATGYGEGSIVERYRERASLSKPYSEEDLARALNEILAHA